MTVPTLRPLWLALTITVALSGCSAASGAGPGSAAFAPAGAAATGAAHGTTGRTVVDATSTAVAAGTAVTAGTGATAGAAVAAVGRRVDGIPRFLAVPVGATVTGSAVQPFHGRLQVSITGTTPAPVSDVLGFYRRTLTAAGFTATDDGLLPPGSTGTAYGHAGQLLVVAVVDHGSVRSFSIGGTVDASGPPPTTPAPAPSRALVPTSLPTPPRG